MQLDDLRPGLRVRGLLPRTTVTLVLVERLDDDTVAVTYRTPDGRINDRILFGREVDELLAVETARPAFDADGAELRLVSEALRIRNAHLFDPYLAVNTSLVEPLPHQIIAVYGTMLPRQPLRFLLADDPGAGKTIMAGLYTTEGRGIWVIDRGGDRGRLFQELLAEEGQRHRFIVRLRGDRHLLRRGFAPMAAMDLARHVAIGHRKRLVREGGGRSTSLDLCFGACRVRLPQQPEIPLWLVVVRGTGKTPLLLLTNVPTSPSSDSLWRIVSSYLTRWSIEEAFRFIKQAYDLENIRVLTFNRIRNLVWLLMLAVYFVAVLLSGPYRLQLSECQRWLSTPLPEASQPSSPAIPELPDPVGHIHQHNSPYLTPDLRHFGEGPA